MLNLLKSELTSIAKKRSISGYKSMSKNKLIKRKEIKESLMKPSKKKILKSIIKQIKEIFHDPIINRDEKIEEIKKILYDPRNNFF